MQCWLSKGAQVEMVNTIGYISNMEIWRDLHSAGKLPASQWLPKTAAKPQEAAESEYSLREGEEVHRTGRRMETGM